MQEEETLFRMWLSPIGLIGPIRPIGPIRALCKTGVQNGDKTEKRCAEDVSKSSEKLERDKVCQFCQNWQREAFLAKTPYWRCLQKLGMAEADGNNGMYVQRLSNISVKK